MDDGVEVAALIGLRVVDHRGRRLGRIIAVIHGRERIDVLVEGRGFIRRRSHRFPIERIAVDARGRACITAPLLPMPATEAGAAVERRVGSGRG